MNNLKIDYNSIQSMPWEYFEWFYNRHLQFLIDLENKKQEQAMSNQ